MLIRIGPKAADVLRRAATKKNVDVADVLRELIAGLGGGVEMEEPKTGEEALREAEAEAEQAPEEKMRSGKESPLRRWARSK